MRALLVLVVLGHLFVLVRRAGVAGSDLTNINPVLLGYGALFAAGIVTAELLRPLLSIMAPVSRFVVVAVLAGLVWFGFDQARQRGLIAEGFLDPNAGQIEDSQDKSFVLLPLAWDGIYRTIAQVNNKSLGVVIDTGTPLVVLQYEEAERLGFAPSKMKFTERVPVADRSLPVARLPFLSVRIDGVELIGVDGAIAIKGGLETSLIGLSFLNRLASFGIHDGKMLLKQ